MSLLFKSKGALAEKKKKNSHIAETRSTYKETCTHFFPLYLLYESDPIFPVSGQLELPNYLLMITMSPNNDVTAFQTSAIIGMFEFIKSTFWIAF